jgi:hypothetical protein
LPNFSYESPDQIWLLDPRLSGHFHASTYIHPTGQGLQNCLLDIFWCQGAAKAKGHLQNAVQPPQGRPGQRSSSKRSVHQQAQAQFSVALELFDIDVVLKPDSFDQAYVGGKLLLKLATNVERFVAVELNRVEF